MRTSQAAIVTVLVFQHAEAEPSVATSASCYDQIENIWILSVVKSELKFVQVQGQIGLADFVIAAHDATLQKRPERFYRVSMCGSYYVFALAVADYAMIVIVTDQAIAGVLIGREQLDASAIRDAANETIQRRRVGVLNCLADDVTLAGNRADDGHLSFGARQIQFLALLGMHVLRFAADESLIDFDLATEQCRAFFLHRGADACAHIPRGFIRAGSHHPMKLVRGDSFLRVAHDEHDLEPRSQRVFGVLENRLSDHAESVSVAPTAILALANPVERAMRDVKHFLIPASRAFNFAVRPSLLNQKALAIIFSLKLLDHLIERSHRRKYRTFYVWCQQSDNPL